ncbi:MAG: ATP-binding protein [Cytophagales bacterium]|nr:ATP-binding protein [Cytophagales bacterium]
MSQLDNNKYTMRMSLNVLNHLGLRLYSNIPAVLSEAVANSYDADATRVDITLDVDNDKIILEDDGHGMTLDDINKKYLYVGYSRRENGEGISPKFKRPVMGRKGIGKLSMFSIANHIEILTARKNLKTNIIEKDGLSMDRYDIEMEISKSEKYHPKDILTDGFDKNQGTRITLTNFKRKINYTSSRLRKRLARRFSILGNKYNFEVYVDGDQIEVTDRDFLGKVQFLWLIGSEADSYSEYYEFEKIEKLNGKIDGTNYEVSGWIGAVEYPSDLQYDDVNNNKVSILCRGKMAQEDILESFTEEGIYADYLIGEIKADFLDLDDEEDIATSSRQKINEEDIRYRELQGHVYQILKKIQSVWTDYRKELNTKKAVENAKIVHPALEEWYLTLKTDTRKKYATELFSTIESFHFDKDEPDTIQKKKGLYVQGIVAFEKLKLRDSLNELAQIKTADDLRLSKIFADLNDLEANFYFDIALERVEVIKQFQKKLYANDKEKFLQKYLFDNLWILNPSWERPTEGSEIMESKVEAEFDKVTESLTEDEKKGRMDIKYRTAAGKHIIIELKRYAPTYKITPVMLYEQLKKYRSGLRKCLATTEEANSPIESIAILGQKFENEDWEEAQRLLAGINARIIHYDELISQSLKSYSDYLDRQKEISKLRKIIEKVVNE